jgi:hypothetical protein
MNEKRLKEIEARAEAAMPGPWVYDTLGCPGIEQRTVRPGGTECRQIVLQNEEAEWSPRHEDMWFIAHARTDIPDLIAAVREAVGLLEEATIDADNAGWGYRWQDQAHEFLATMRGEGEG